MKSLTLYLLFFCLPFVFVGQTAINSTNALADDYAVLDVASSTRGVILPSLTNAQMLSIAFPATGLIVYNSTNSAFYYFNGTIWAKVGTKGKILQDTDTDTKIQVEKTSNEDKIRIDVGNAVTPIPDMAVVDASGLALKDDYEIPAGKTLKIGATPMKMPSAAGQASSVLSTDGAGNWQWMEPHGGLGIAAGIQTMYFAETTSIDNTSVSILGDNTIYTPVLPFSSMTITKIEACALLNGTVNSVLRFAVFDENGNNLGYGDTSPITADGIVSAVLTPTAPATSIFIQAAKLYYFAITEINDQNIQVFRSTAPFSKINPLNKMGGATDELNTPTWLPIPTSYTSYAVWMVAH